MDIPIKGKAMSDKIATLEEHWLTINSRENIEV